MVNGCTVAKEGKMPYSDFMEWLRESLEKTYSGELGFDPAAIERVSTDASIFSVTPKALAHPKNARELEELVSFAQKHYKEGVSLTARSAGTDMSGGPLNDSVIVDFTKYFTAIGPVENETITVEPGVYYRDFEKATLSHHLLLPSYPASRELCTVGGMVANNSGGEKSLSYGKTEDYVEALKIVLSDGREYEFRPLSKQELRKKLQKSDMEGKVYTRVYELLLKHSGLLKKTKPHISKNSAGYNLWRVWDGKTFDMTKLFVGSQGTLGLITQITFRLIRPKDHSRLLVIFLNDFSQIGSIVRTVLQLKPESFESYDDNTLRLAIRFFPDILKRMKKASLLSLAWNFLPEFWMILAGGMPKLILIAEFTGDSLEEATKKAEQARHALTPFDLKTHVTRSDGETQKYWIIRRESFSLLREHVNDKQTAPFIDDFIVTPASLPEFLPKLEKLMSDYPLTYTIAGHVGNGNFHIIPLMNLGDPSTPVIIKELSQKVYNLVAEFHGSITAEHNDGLIRTPFLETMYGKEVVSLFEEIKHIFDPKGIFNPGKKVGMSFAKAMRYLKKKT